MFDTKNFAETYAQSKENHPFRTEMERYSILSWLGTVEGKRVLDLACGTGNYSRMFCRLGASEVTGVDSSREMINSALSHTPDIMPVAYHTQPAEDYVNDIPYDLVFHAYLLNCASSPEKLNELCRVLYRHLAVGGQMLGIMGMLGHYPSGSKNPSGCYTAYQGELSEGDGYTIFFPGQQEAVNHYWRRSTCHSALVEAGFSDIRWYLPSDNRSHQMPVDDWIELEENPVFIGVSATR
ncbi:class I SAM-dependent methyltransferase [Endozoicomonas gorgoniicola]|uniref:Class I SAM-dependent methyltransferase n=1 Tax=Endozoicomonas gorgoniicola TaxID=1234144 RepID=A0ABT3MRF8_9GAMM|nr:class I SAM-dependent methyltransferase [Endozoicomonas gorgoniicola]MCW7551956.1 class I SAM-dependent methyltransferase [Endozoicomonas gorgoniicola]